MSYEGSGLPGWISSPRNSLRELHLVELNELSTLPPLGKLRSLECLSVTKLMKMKILGREFLGLESSSSLPSDGVVDAFPRLQMLAFTHLPEWEKWEDITAEEYAADVSIMPHLMEYSSIWCKGQKKLPHFLREKMSSLKIIYIPGPPPHLDTDATGYVEHTYVGHIYGSLPQLETSYYGHGTGTCGSSWDFLNPFQDYSHHYPS